MSQEFEPNGDGEDRINQQMDEIMCDTPRTDEALDAAQESGDPAFHLSNLCYTLETENATLKARIAELEANARTDEILLEASQEATQRQVERVRELTEWRPMETADLTLCGNNDNESEYVIVCTDIGCVGEAYYSSGMWNWAGCGATVYNPIGWLPLPTSKGESNE